FSDIEQNQDKVTHALFWFTNLNQIDNTAIQHLISGNREKAIEIWEKLTDGKEVSDKNFSAFNNIGTLYLLEHSKEKIKQGITTKIKLITSEYFKEFAHSVADETFSIDAKKQSEIFVDELLSQFKQNYSVKETMDLFSDCDEIVQTYLSKKFTEEPIHIIETHIEQTRSKRTKNKINANQFATELFTKTKNELSILKPILGTDNLQYKMLADNIAKELLQCSIDYFNESQKQGKSNDYISDSLKISQWAESVAASEITRTKVREDTETLERMKDRELLEAIRFLQSIKKAYKKAYDELLRMVKKDLGIKENGIYMNIIPIEYDDSLRRINYSAIDRAARDSINKEVILDLDSKVLTKQAIVKIAQSGKEDKIEEFYELLKYVNYNIIRLNLNEKEDILYNALPQSSNLYKLISEQKERERIDKIKMKEREERDRKHRIEFAKRKEKAEIERQAKE